MNCIKIFKEDGSTYPLYFTDIELEQIHRFVEYRNLQKDFINKLADHNYQAYSWLRVEHVEAIPELLHWLIQDYWNCHHAESSHNDTFRDILNHFLSVAITPKLFQDLEAYCLTVTPDNPRQKKLAAATKIMELHEQRTCACLGGPKNWCAARHYLSGHLDIRDFIEASALSEKEGQEPAE